MCTTSADLIKLAADKDEQLQASSISSITRFIKAEIQRQNAQTAVPRRQFGARVADIPKEEEEELSSLVTDAKPLPNVRASGNYPYPLASNRSNKVPPRPCRNCGSPLHYDRDCASWRSQGRPITKAVPKSKAGESYHNFYIAMLEEDEEAFDENVATFLTLLDDQSTDVMIVQSDFHSDLGTLPQVDPADIYQTASLDDEMSPLVEISSAWSKLPVNMTEMKENEERPTKDLYVPTPVWERPAGQAVQGIDAFKIHCHVNHLKEPAAVVVGDSGAAPTLISQKFLDSLRLSKPKKRTGRRLKLIQLTGSTGCSEFVQ